MAQRTRVPTRVCLATALATVLVAMSVINVGLAVVEAQELVEQAPTELARVDLGVGAGTSVVYDVARSLDGFAWIATDLGLVRWDGTSAETFSATSTNQPPLPQYVVTSVATRRDGAVVLAAGTLNTLDPIRRTIQDEGVDALQLHPSEDGLWIIDRRSVSHRAALSNQVRRIAAHEISPFPDASLPAAVSPSGSIGIGTHWGVLIVAPDGAVERVTLPGGVTALGARSAGGFWAASEGYLWQLQSDGSFQALLPELGGNDVPNTGADGVAELDDGSLLLAVDGRLPRIFDPESGSARVLQLADASSSDVSYQHLSQDDDGVIWIGTAGYGLFMLSPETAPFEPVDLGPEIGAVADVAFRDGDVWLASNRLGLVRGRLDGYRFVTAATTHPVPRLAGRHRVIQVEATQRGIWVRTAQGLIAHYNIDDRSFSHLPGWEVLGAVDMTATESGSLVVVSDRGVHLFDADGRAVRSIDVDELGSGANLNLVVGGSLGTWVAGSGFLALLSEGGSAATIWNRPRGEVGDQVYAIVEDEQDRQSLWLGTSAGIERLDLDSGQFELHSVDAGVSAGAVQALSQRSDDTMWAATTEGVVVFDSGRRKKLFKVDPKVIGLGETGSSLGSSFARDGAGTTLLAATGFLAAGFLGVAFLVATFFFAGGFFLLADLSLAAIMSKAISKFISLGSLSLGIVALIFSYLT